MRDIQNLDQAQAALNGFISTHPSTRRYDLGRMRKLMGYLGNPQNSLKIIHIAGTSGKTSTAYYTTALLRQAGYKVGLTVSPHVDSVIERAQIDLKPLDEPEYCTQLSKFLDLTDKSEIALTYFEVLIAFAYWLFSQYSVDYAVIEVGIGGLLDSTNVINNPDKICIITDIGFDHTAILGNTMEQIAFQKAGIIENKNTVFAHTQDDVTMQVIKKVCADKNAILHIAPSDLMVDDTVNKLPLFQQRNFKLALAAVRYVVNRAKGTLSDDNITTAAQTYIPARMETILLNERTILFDGSHNEQKIGALVQAVRAKYPNSSVTLLVSFGKNKESTAAVSLALLRQISSKIIITRFDLGQEGVGPSIEPGLLAAFAQTAVFSTIIIEPNPLTAFELLKSDDAQIGLVTGSFYLLNHYRPAILAESRREH